MIQEKIHKGTAPPFLSSPHPKAPLFTLGGPPLCRPFHPPVWKTFCGFDISQVASCFRGSLFWPPAVFCTLPLNLRNGAPFASNQNRGGKMSSPPCLGDRFPKFLRSGGPTPPPSFEVVFSSCKIVRVYISCCLLFIPLSVTLLPFRAFFLFPDGPVIALPILQ